MSSIVIRRAILIAGLALCTGSLQAQLASSPWPKWQRDLRNSGWTPAVGPDEPRVKWALDFTGISLQAGPAIGPEGELYVGWSICFQPKFISLVRGQFWSCARFARVSMDGDIEWERPLTDFYASFATLDSQGRIFVVDGWIEDRYTESHSYAFAHDGRRLWGPRVDPPFAPYQNSHMTIGRDGTIYYPDGQTLRALRPADGSEIWRRFLGNQSPAYECPSIGEDGTVYIAGDSRVFALDPADGAVRWVVDGPYPSDTTGTSIGPGGIVYVSFNPRGASLLAAIEPGGQIAWQIPHSGQAHMAPSIDPEGRLYLFTYSEQTSRALLEAYDSAGASLWQVQLGNESGGPIVIDGHGNLYVATLSLYPTFTRLLSYTAEGESRWEFSAYTSAIPRYQAPVIGPDGTIYLMVDGRISGRHHALLRLRSRRGARPGVGGTVEAVIASRLTAACGRIPCYGFPTRSAPVKNRCHTG